MSGNLELSGRIRFFTLFGIQSEPENAPINPEAQSPNPAINATPIRISAFVPAKCFPELFDAGFIKGTEKSTIVGIQKHDMIKVAHVFGKLIITAPNSVKIIELRAKKARPITTKMTLPRNVDSKNSPKERNLLMSNPVFFANPRSMLGDLLNTTFKREP